MSVIEIKNLSFKYEGEKKCAVKDLTLTVKEGEFLVVLGRNGSGKSTLARLINGLLIAKNGEVFVDGVSTKDTRSLFDIRKKVGVVFQNPDNQLIASIVEDDIAFGPENIGVKREEISERIDFALKAVGMEEFRKSTPTMLSGGQKQRIAIAGVLAIKPEVLILDESTSMLDPRGRKEVMDVVKKLNKENNMTVIHITHYMDEVLGADRVVVLNEGKIIKEGTPTTVFEDVDLMQSVGLDVPLALKVSKSLQGDFPIKDCLTKEELKDQLISLLK